MAELASPQATATRKGRPFKGWRIVGIAALFHGIMGGLNHTGLAVYFLPLTREFGVSHTKLSVVFALRTLEGGLEGPFIGYLIDRLGSRPMILAGALAGGSGFILLAMTRSFTMFLVVFLALVTVGFSVPHHGLFATINQWFRRRLGLAMSLATSGSAIGGFLLTPVVAWVVLNRGWRSAATYSGILMLVVGLPLGLMVRKPTQVEAEGDESPVAVASKGPPSPSEATPSNLGVTEDAVTSPIDFTIGEALRTSTYWLLATAIGLRLAGQQILIVHMVPILVSKGVGEATAASLVALMSLMRLPGIIGAGFLGDMWSRQKVSSLTMTVGSIAAAAAVWGPAGLSTGIAFSILFAGAQASNAITWALIGHYFGRSNFASLRGGVTLVQSLMSTVGPVVAGWVFDTTGSYNVALLGVLGLYGLAALMFWNLKAPTKAQHRH